MQGQIYSNKFHISDDYRPFDSSLDQQNYP